MRARARGRAAGPAALLAAVWGAACAHPPAVPLDVAAAGASSASTDFADIETLEAMRDLGGGALAGWLRAGDPAYRRRAALALGRIADESSFPALREALRDPDASVRAEAAFALGIAADEGAAADLARAAASERDPQAKADALEALGHVSGAGSLAVIAAGMADAHPAVREGALRGLLHLAGRKVQADDAAGVALTAALTAPEPALRFLALYTAGRVVLPATLRPPLAAALRSAPPSDDAESTAMRLKALAAVIRTAGRPDPPDTDLFAAGLAHPDWRVRVEAARGLATCGPEAADRLAAWLLTAADPSPHPVRAALDALASHAARPRVMMAAQKHAPICEAAALLERAGQRAAALACDAPSFRRKMLHAQVLGSLPAVPAALLPVPPAAGQTVAPPVSVPARLAELALLAGDGDPRVRAAAVAALGEIDLPAVGALAREALRDKDPAVVGAAADVLRRAAEDYKRPDRQATAGLTAALPRLQSATAAESMIAILGALGAGGDPRAIPTVRWARGDPNWSVRRAARVALGALGDTAPPPAPRPPPPAAMPGDVESLRSGRRVSAVIVTARGEIEVALYAAEAPANVASFVFLATRGFYKGLTFHRVVPGFVIQGGDPRADGTGGPGYDVRCEYSRRRFVRGSVGIALAGRDTGGSQIFVTHAPTPHLDGRFTVFGDVVRGQDAADAIVAGDTITDVIIKTD